MIKFFFLTVVKRVGSWWLETLQKNTGGLKIHYSLLVAPGILKIIGGPHVRHWWPQDFSPNPWVALERAPESPERSDHYFLVAAPIFRELVENSHFF